MPDGMSERNNYVVYTEVQKRKKASKLLMK